MPHRPAVRYCMVSMGDYSNVGWVLFLADKSGVTVTSAFRGSFATIKSLIAVHGPVGSMRTGNGLDLVNDNYQGMLTELDIKRGFMPVDGVTCTGAERKLGLIAARAQAVWLKFPRQLADLQLPVQVRT